MALAKNKMQKALPQQSFFLFVKVEIISSSFFKCCLIKCCTEFAPRSLGHSTPIQLDKLELIYPKSNSNLFQCSVSFDSISLIWGTIVPAKATVFS